MVNKISKQQAYINAAMAKLPDVKNKKEHILKKGETLWKKKKKNLNKKNASNNEINNRMLLIAKINNLKTVEKMNNLKVNQKIYLPSGEGQAVIAKKRAKNQQNNKQIAKNVKRKTIRRTVQKTPQKAQQKNTAKQANLISRSTNQAVQSANSAFNTLKNDKTVKVEKVRIYNNSECYHVTNEEKTKYGFINKNNMVLSFNVDGNKQIKDVFIEDSKRNLNVFGYDYKIDKNGTIRQNQYPFNVKGQLSKQENAQMKAQLQNAMKKAR